MVRKARAAWRGTGKDGNPRQLQVRFINFEDQTGNAKFPRSGKASGG